MNNSVVLLDEPALEFAGGQRCVDPHDGLTLFGPNSLGTSSHPNSTAYIAIGTPNGLSKWHSFSSQLNNFHTVPEAQKRNLWPPFPGFDVAFGYRWPTSPLRSFEIDGTALLQASKERDAHHRCFNVVDLYLNHFSAAKRSDSNVALAVCVVPDDVWQNCRPESRVLDPIGQSISKTEKKSRRAGQLNIFEEYHPEQYSLSPDFRRQLKARSMQYDIPVQIVRESTLNLASETIRGERRLTPVSDRLWNLGTALYYKSGGKPWKLASAREGVCYIGIAFRLADDQRTACCAAQMFLDSGDGIVFLGEYGPWWSPEKKAFHLTKKAARELLSGILKTYSEMDGRPLREIFLHSRSWLEQEELNGFNEACPKAAKLTGIRVRPDRYGPRLFRIGSMPILRGTFFQETDKIGYLFGSGFKPRLGTYDGWETPVPLLIQIQHGEANLRDVAQDILGLTKLNYNACRLGESQPVTVGFSDAVGEILISNPNISNRRPNFKFYI